MSLGWRGYYLRYRSYFLNVAARYKERADVKAYIEILLSLATISAFAIFALRPTLLTIAGLIKEIESKRQTLEQMQSKIDNLTSAHTLYDRERQKINILLSAIPDMPNPENYARQVEGLIGKHNAQISESRIGKAVILGKKTAFTNKSRNSKPLPEGSIGLNVSTSYTANLDQYISLVNLISDFENLRRPPQIDTIRIKTSTTREKEKVLELFINARLPYFTGSAQ